MPPTLDELRSRHVVTGVPSSDDLIPYIDVDEVGNSVVKKTLVSGLSAALLNDDGNLEVDGLVLSDSSAVALDSGVIGWNTSLGAFVEHDGTTVGGVVIAPTHPWSAKGSKALLTAALATAQLTELFRFPLTSAQAVVGKRYKLTGSYCLGFNGTRPVECLIGLVPAAAVADGVGVLHGDDWTGNTIKVVKADIYWEFTIADAGSGGFNIEAYTHHSSVAKLVGAASSVAVLDSAYNLVSTPGVLGAAQDLVLQLQTAATVSSAPVFAIYDLKLEATN